jgi:uncharacterized repeat protein (TIGR01451 family)
MRMRHGEGGWRRSLCQATASAVLAAGMVVLEVAGASPASAAVIFAQNFDGVTAPALPAGWTTTGEPSWTTTTASADTPPNAAFAPDARDFTKDMRLDSPVISLPSGLNILTFHHRYDIELWEPGVASDGAVLEMKIGSGSFRDILAAGGTFLSGGYDARTLHSPPFFNSPLGDRSVWSGRSPGFVTTVVNLPAASSGQDVVFRWRYAQDNARFTTDVFVGWWVDSISIDNPRADLSVTKSGPSQVAVGGQATYSVTVSNGGADPASTVSMTDTLPAGLGFVSVSPPSGWTCPTTPALGDAGDIVCTRPDLTVAAGPQTFQIVAQATSPGSVTNTARVTSATRDLTPGNNSDTATTNVVKASPAISTVASPGGTVGTVTVTDTATVSGGFNPTGSVTFRLFSDSGCATQVSTSAVALTGATATSAAHTPTTAGTYYWTAVYAGDTLNNSATSPCRAPNESVTVAKATPSLSTQSSGDNLVGAPVSDTATLTGGFNPGGTVTFRLYTDASCNAQVFTLPGPVTAGTATSGWFTPTTAGAYRWTASYSGDVNNEAVSGACGAPGESVALAPFAPPAFTRTLTGDVPGPVNVAAGESVLITRARIAGAVTVAPGGALTMEASSVSRGVSVDRPRFLSICGTEMAGPPPASALTVSGAMVPVRIGDPAAGCAANRFAGPVTLSADLATTFAANTVSQDLSVTGNGPGNTVLRGNTVLATLSCTGNAPAPDNGGQANIAKAKTGQCTAV